MSVTLFVAVGGAAVLLTPLVWGARMPVPYDLPGLSGFPEGIALWHAWWRASPAAVWGFAAMAALMLMSEVAPHEANGRLTAGWRLSFDLSLACWLGASVSVALFNRPRLLVPPAWRDRPGLIRELLDAWKGTSRALRTPRGAAHGDGWHRPEPGWRLVVGVTTWFVAVAIGFATAAALDHEGREPTVIAVSATSAIAGAVLGLVTGPHMRSGKGRAKLKFGPWVVLVLLAVPGLRKAFPESTQWMLALITSGFGAGYFIVAGSRRALALARKQKGSTSIKDARSGS